MSYSAALEAAGEPHRVLLGPAPCQGCGAWVEWAGVEWLALGSQERHSCAPFLAGQADALCVHGRQGPHATEGMLPYGDGHCSGPGSWWPTTEVVAEWTRPAPEPYRQAHEALPMWPDQLGTVILTLAALLAWAFVVVLVVRWLLGWPW